MGEGATGATPTDEAFRCYVGAGNGYVVRRGSLLAVIAPSTHPQSSGLVELLTTGPSDWSDLVREIAGRITVADYMDLPTIGVLDTQNRTTAVFLYGDVVASLSGTVERVHLDGSRAVTWVEQSYSGGNYESVELRTSASGEFEISTDLRAGVVLGAALKLTSAPERPTSGTDHRVATPSPIVDGPHRSTGPVASAVLEPPPPAELKPEPEAERFTELRITSLIESLVPPVPVPHELPDSAEPSGQLDSDHTYIVNPDRLAPRAERVIWAQAPAPTSPVLPPGQVRGVGCPSGHPNRSTDVSCRICGDAVDADGEPIVGPRPPLGWLIVDDETTICLDVPCVVGHLPPQDHMISGELARAITLDDQKHRISRRHVEIHLVGWEARAVDCGSTNGTRFRRAGSRRSGPLKPNEPQPLGPGDELELGKRTLTFVDQLP